MSQGSAVSYFHDQGSYVLASFVHCVPFVTFVTFVIANVLRRRYSSHGVRGASSPREGPSPPDT
jgi:hypothetical protein